MKTVILKKGKAKPFWHGEALIFSGAVHSVIEGQPVPAELVNVVSAENKHVGIGVFNPYSSYRVRLLLWAHEKVEPTIEMLVQHRLQQAYQKRQLMNLPNAETNAYRLCHSEGDQLSGVTIDLFDTCAVVYVTAYWAQEYRQTIESILHELPGINTVYWRAQRKALSQDGWRENASEDFSKESHQVIIKENNLLYTVDLSAGQKTGFYCDQRDNRFFLRQYVKNKKVLDCYCYTGGFALNAAVAGAREVVAVDSSQPAIALARQNAAMNHLTQITFSAEKAEKLLENASDYEVIILDPPKLAPSYRHLPQAKQHYLKLNQLALAALPSGGLLFTCSCSDAMTQSQFLAMLKQAAKIAGRTIEILSILGAGADHPVLKGSKYGAYLKAVLVRMMN